MFILSGCRGFGQAFRTVQIIISQTNISFIRRYLYNGESILAEYDGNNQLLASYTHSLSAGDDILSVNITSDGVLKSVGISVGSFFYLKDANGNITDIADINGQKVQHHVYSAFGKLLKVEDANGNDVTDAPVLDPFFTFTGRELDKETGLYYYRARYYDSSTGRFISVDPDAGQINSPQTVTNKYIYAINNPLRFSDPTGENIFDDFKDIAEDIGSAFGKWGSIAIGHFLAEPLGQWAAVNFSGQFSQKISIW